MSSHKVFYALVVIFAFCSCETALEKSLVEEKVVLLAPVNNLKTTELNHTFYWEHLDGSLAYQLQLVSPQFDSIIALITDTIVDYNGATIKLKPGKYQWKIRALNNSTSSKYSNAWNLKIE